MNPVLIYAFSNQWGTNISRRTLLELQKNFSSPSCQRGGQGEIEFRLIRFHPKSFFEKYIKNNSYRLIIGLGDYYGDISKIRIETQARNLYRDQNINPFLPLYQEISLPFLDFVDSQNFSISENMGKYYSNWIAFQTEVYLKQYSPDTKHLFLHLPPKINSHILAKNITDLLINNQMIK